MTFPKDSLWIDKVLERFTAPVLKSLEIAHYHHVKLIRELKTRREMGFSSTVTAFESRMVHDLAKEYGLLPKEKNK
jgi:hypothetical protein